MSLDQLHEMAAEAGERIGLAKERKALETLLKKEERMKITKIEFEHGYTLEIGDRVVWLSGGGLEKTGKIMEFHDHGLNVCDDKGMACMLAIADVTGKVLTAEIFGGKAAAHFTIPFNEKKPEEKLPFDLGDTILANIPVGDTEFRVLGKVDDIHPKSRTVSIKNVDGLFRAGYENVLGKLMTHVESHYVSISPINIS